jgi:hypothetical protein
MITKLSTMGLCWDCLKPSELVATEISYQNGQVDQVALCLGCLVRRAKHERDREHE